VKGFRLPGDRADYAVEVQKPLSVSVVIDGERFDQCAPISLLVDGKPVAAESRSADKIIFGTVALPEGTSPLSLAVADDAEAGTAIGEVLKMTLRLEP
jgi:hypothetical protein